ncbi:MAG: UDP-N-acetylmuramate:L-alanyl-gamma-D-glutamyl-meso-diaminopimelate ligase [Duodenibacillus sp.]|nr:UDP-N-acetylmuramate:L-alanyl-gamma-D-glutamyl-meso-diaminopimelate ligase [Duodenibacillus sp.]
MHIHILGICGTFMGGLAQLAAACGHKVTGCDKGVYPPMSEQLEQAGIALTEGYGSEQVALGADLWIVGNAISRGNPLLEAILEAGLPYCSGPQWLGEHVLAGRHVLAVAGTHGKTTTTAMLAWILECAGKKPGFLVGGVPMGFGVSARLGEGRHFVIEADEYDTAFCDKRSKFVHYRPRTAVLNNLEYDHADIFEDLAAIEKQFHHLVRTVPAGGLVVANGQCEALDRVLAMGCWSRVHRFGAGGPGPGWTVSEQGDVALNGIAFGRLELPLPGRHNLCNALAAVAAACDAGVSPVVSLQALSRFPGVRRRMELKGVAAGVKVLDDFAHHPTAIAETIAAVRRTLGAGRLIAVLEPRSNTMKLGTMKDRLPGALAAADRVFCYQGPGVRWSAADALAALGEKASCHCGDLAPLVEAVAGFARPGDVVLCMSNGSFGGVHGKLLAALAAR